MKRLSYPFKLLRRHRETTMLASVFLLLMTASVRPTIQVERDVHSYFLIVDLSQSMNVMDMTVRGKTMSRMAYTRNMLQEILASLPCETEVGIGVFSGSSVAALYTPIEVCSSYDVLKTTVDHLEWREAWAGNSRIRNGMLSLRELLHTFPEPAQVVFFTDGEEAPALHVFNTLDLSNFQNDSEWLLVGIGSETGAPIPKYAENNQLLGYWAADSLALQPGISQISEGNIGVRDTSVAQAQTDRYISKRAEGYLKRLAKEVHGHYVNGSSLGAVLTAMQEQKTLRKVPAPFDFGWMLAFLAAGILLYSYIGPVVKQRRKSRH